MTTGPGPHLFRMQTYLFFARLFATASLIHLCSRALDSHTWNCAQGALVSKRRTGQRHRAVCKSTAIILAIA